MKLRFNEMRLITEGKSRWFKPDNSLEWRSAVACVRAEANRNLVERVRPQVEYFLGYPDTMANATQECHIDHSYRRLHFKIRVGFRGLLVLREDFVGILLVELLDFSCGEKWAV